MKFCNILYSDNPTLKREIENSGFLKNDECLVRVHISNADKDYALALAKSIKKLLPNSKIAGLTTSGVIYNGKIHNDGTLISITGFENSEITSFLVDATELSNKDIENFLIEKTNSINTTFGFLFFTDASYEVFDILKNVKGKINDVKFIGGIAATLTKSGDGFDSFIFDENNVYENGFSVSFVENGHISIYSNVIVGHEPLGKTYKITKAHKDYIEEIEGEDALEWIYKELGITELLEDESIERRANVDPLVRFPLTLENEDGASRFLQYEKETRKLKLYFTSLKEGQEFKISYLNTLKSIQEWQDTCLDLQKVSSEYVFAYSCLFRRLYLENLALWEMKPFENQNICAAFLNGEIGNKGENNNFYNGACSFFTFATQEKTIDIDLSAFENIAQLEDSNDELLENLLNIRTHLDKNNDKIFDAIVEDVKEKYNLRAFKNDKIKGVIDFIKDQKEDEKTKIGLILIKAFSKEDSGKETYKIVFEKLESGTNALVQVVEEKYPELNFNLYSYNRNAVFFTIKENVPDARFIEISKAIYDFVLIEKNKTIDVDLYAKMMISLQGEKIQSLFTKAQNSKKDDVFAISSDANEDNRNQAEFKTLTVIKKAVEENAVYPYLQGIYSNRYGKFFAYEALMRLKTADGNLLFPEQFLEIAKKYGLYSDLSFIMIDKTLDFFKNSKDIIFINVSVDDIVSAQFTQKLFEKLKSIDDASNFVFEICDIENCKNYNELNNFMQNIKLYKCKISIGELQFIDMKLFESIQMADYLKIDKDFIENELKEQMVKDVYSYAKKLQAEIIVKKVETMNSQKAALNKAIKYSQGFLFSKPMKIEDYYSEFEIANRLTQEDKDAIDSKNENKKSNLLQRNSRFYMGGIIAVVMAILAVVVFSGNNNRLVSDMNDAFLVELATNTTDKIALYMDNATSDLITYENIVSKSYSEDIALHETLEIIGDSTNFDEVYVSYMGEVPLSASGEELGIEVTDYYFNSKEGEVSISSPVINQTNQETIFFVHTPVVKDGQIIGEIFGVYNLKDFSDLLDIKSFGGEAFFHLCEVNGTPLILSGDSNNLFQGGDMYTFIGSLNIVNGHTPESIKQDMKNDDTVLLKYDINGEERTAVMITVPGTQWCIVSIILDEIVVQMVSEINSTTLTFSLFLIIVFALYFTLTLLREVRTQKDLVLALESSYILANDLQSSIETDSLTKTYSRITVTEKITELIKQSKHNDEIHALAMIDVDNFKSINDTYGHQVGDIYLQEFAATVKKSLRTGDLLGRLGGDEFILLLNNIEDLTNVKNVLDRTIKSVNNIEIENVSLDEVSISIGVVIIPKDGDDYQDLNNKADKALYFAKNAGKNRYIIYDDIN